MLARERGDDGRWFYVHKTAGSREHMKGRMEGEGVALFFFFFLHVDPFLRKGEEMK